MALTWMAIFVPIWLVIFVLFMVIAVGIMLNPNPS